MRAPEFGRSAVNAWRSHTGSRRVLVLGDRVDEPDEAGPRVLVVEVASQVLSPALLDAVRERSAAAPTQFYLVLPDPAEHAELTAGQRRESRARGEEKLERALSLLSEAAGHEVDGSVSMRHDVMDVIEETLGERRIDEVMLGITHHRIAERLHMDLPRRVEHLGIPVTTVIEGEQLSESSTR